MENSPITDSLGTIEVSASPDKVSLWIKSAGSGHSDGIPNPGRLQSEIETKFADLGIVHGVDWAMIGRILEEQLFDKSHVVATSSPAENGKDGQIEETGRVDEEGHPVLGQDGRADYRNIGHIHEVEKNEVLAIKHPPTAGSPGIDVFGKSIAPQAGQDIPFSLGSNTIVSEDGQNLLAAVNGYLYHANGAICVGEAFIVPNGVNFRSGNIRYKGNVIVKGDITDGFVVDAGGDIMVEGIVEGAHLISHEGSITVKGGVFGRGKAIFSARHSIVLNMAQDATFECDILEVYRGMLHCGVVCRVMTASKQGCIVCGCEIKAYEAVEVAIAGSEGSRMNVHLVDRQSEEFEKAIGGLRKAEAELQHGLAGLEVKLKDLQMISLRQNGKLSPGRKVELKSLLEKRAEINAKLSGNEMAKDDLLSSYQPAHTLPGSFLARDQVHDGVHLDMYGVLRELVPTDAKTRIGWVEGDLVFKPM